MDRIGSIGSWSIRNGPLSKGPGTLMTQREDTEARRPLINLIARLGGRRLLEANHRWGDAAGEDGHAGHRRHGLARGVHLSGALGRGTRTRGPRRGVGAGREAVVSGPDQGQQRLVEVLGDGACPALNSPMFVVDSSGRRSDVSKRERMLQAWTSRSAGPMSD